MLGQFNREQETNTEVGHPTKSEWADFAASMHRVGTQIGNELTRSVLGNIQPQSSQLAKPLWTDPRINSGISVRELISALKKKSAGGE